jgi:hypothetical protein
VFANVLFVYGERFISNYLTIFLGAEFENKKPVSSASKKHFVRTRGLPSSITDF